MENITGMKTKVQKYKTLDHWAHNTVPNQKQYQTKTKHCNQTGSAVINNAKSKRQQHRAGTQSKRKNTWGKAEQRSCSSQGQPGAGRDEDRQDTTRAPSSGGGMGHRSDGVRNSGLSVKWGPRARALAGHDPLAEAPD